MEREKEREGESSVMLTLVALPAREVQWIDTKRLLERERPETAARRSTSGARSPGCGLLMALRVATELN